MWILWNGVRLGATLVLGLVAIRLAAALGPDALAVFLVLLALRQAGLVFPTARESAVIAGRGAGAGRGAPVLALGAMVLTAGLPPGPSAGLATLAWLAAAWWSAPGMAGLLLGGRVRAYNLAIALRRGGDALALGFLLLAGAEGVGALAMALTLSACWAWGVGLWVQRARSAPRPVRLAGDRPHFLILGLSGALVLRGPVLLAAALFGASGAADLALAGAVAGYVRQAGSAVLSGLDAVVRRSAQPGAALTRATGLQSAAMGALSLGLGVWAEPILTVVTGAPPTQGAAALLPLLALALGLRAVAETWTKALGGLGRIDLVARPLLLSALGYGGVVACALAVLPTQGVFFAIAGLLCGLQVAIIWAVLSGPVARVFGGSARAHAALALSGPAVAAIGLWTTVPLWLAAPLCAAPLGVYLRPSIASRISVRSTSAP